MSEERDDDDDDDDNDDDNDDDDDDTETPDPVQAQIPSHPGIKYPVRGIPPSDENTGFFYFVDPQNVG